MSVSDTVGCLDTLRPTDSISAVVKMSVKSRDPEITLPPDFEGLLVQEFRSRLKLPANLPLGVMHGWSSCDTILGKCSAGALVLGSQAYVTAHNNGTVSRTVVIDYNVTPALSDSVAAVLTRIGEEKLMPFFAQPDSIPIDIAINIEQHPDSIPAFRQLFRAVIPRFDLGFTFGDFPRTARPPIYPSKAERSGIGDTVKVSFTILADGTIAPRSVDVQKAHYREFVEAVLELLGRIRYIPARIGGCAVASHAQQQFIFAARRR
jgi:TonB family protein